MGVPSQYKVKVTLSCEPVLLEAKSSADHEQVPVPPLMVSEVDTIVVPGEPGEVDTKLEWDAVVCAVVAPAMMLRISTPLMASCVVLIVPATIITPVMVPATIARAF